MEWYWWVLIIFWTGGFGWAVGNVRTALRNRHERRFELMEAQKHERLAVRAADRASQVYAGELTDLA